MMCAVKLNLRVVAGLTEEQRAELRHQFKAWGNVVTKNLRSQILIFVQDRKNGFLNLKQKHKGHKKKIEGEKNHKTFISFLDEFRVKYDPEADIIEEKVGNKWVVKTDLWERLNAAFNKCRPKKINNTFQSRFCEQCIPNTDNSKCVDKSTGMENVSCENSCQL